MTRMLTRRNNLLAGDIGLFGKPLGEYGVRRLAGQGKLVIAVAHDLRVAADVPRRALAEENLARAFAIRARVLDNPAGQWNYFLEE